MSLTPRQVRRALIPITYFIFVAGMVVSSAECFRVKPFDVKRATISELMSPNVNPDGHGVAAVATTVAAMLLIPAVIRFHLSLRKKGPRLALAGATMFGIGLTAAIGIGVLSPFVADDCWLHGLMAYSAFIGIGAGTVCHLLAARATASLIALQSGVLVILGYLYFATDFFANHGLLSSLASLEGLLCLDCGIGLWALAKQVEKHWAEKSAQARSGD